MLEQKQRFERLVLSSIMVLGSRGDNIKKQLKLLKDNYFTHKKQRDIFNYIVNEYNETGTIDLISVDHKYPEDDILVLASECEAQDYAAPVFLDKYISSLILEFKNEQMVKLSEHLSSPVNIQDKMEMIEKSVKQIEVSDSKYKLRNISDIIKEAHETNEKVPTSYPGLDKHLKGGFEKKRLYTIAGRPGTGKSTFMMNLGLNMAVNQKKKILFVTLEMPDFEMVGRIAMRATVGRSTLNQDERQNWLATEEKYKELRDNLTVTELGNNIHTLKSIAEDYDVVCIDQLSFMRTSKKFDNKAQEVSIIVHELKEFALKENKVVILASQLNRQASSHGEVPRLHHLKESGGIEEASDAVILLSENEEEHVILADLAKNRSGTVGKVFFNAQFSSMMFKECSKPDDIPPNYERTRNWQDNF